MKGTINFILIELSGAQPQLAIDFIPKEAEAAEPPNPLVINSYFFCSLKCDRWLYISQKEIKKCDRWKLYKSKQLACTFTVRQPIIEVLSNLYIILIQSCMYTKILQKTLLSRPLMQKFIYMTASSALSSNAEFNTLFIIYS